MTTTTRLTTAIIRGRSSCLSKQQLTILQQNHSEFLINSRKNIDVVTLSLSYQSILFNIHSFLYTSHIHG